MACTANLTLEYGADPVLPSARGAWVDMQYRVQMSRSKAAAIEIHANSRFIVTVTGKIGYRDYLPSVDTMDIDRVEVQPSD